jgi:hypothetical protein
MASAVGYDRSAFGFWLWQQCLWLFAIASVVIGLFTLVQWFVAIIAGALGFQPLAMAATLVVRYMGPGALTVAVAVRTAAVIFGYGGSGLSLQLQHLRLVFLQQLLWRL